MLEVVVETVEFLKIPITTSTQRSDCADSIYRNPLKNIPFSSSAMSHVV